MQETGLRRVAIGNGVTNIGKAAFRGCELLSDVSWGDSIEWIGEEAFRGCPVTNIAIGAGTRFIGERAFAGNNAVRTISVAEGNPAYAMIDGVLYTQDGKNLIRCPKGREGATHAMPDTLESIGEEAFSGCAQLVSVDIPSGVTNIGAAAFAYCRGLAAVEIPAGVTSLASNVFYYCDGLTRVAIPGTVASIGNEAFYRCDNLVALEIADGVEFIGQRAFAYDRKLASVVVPESLKGIASSAFSGCTNLASVHICDLAAWCGISFEYADANPLSFAKRLYLDGKEVTDLAVPDGVARVGAYAFYGGSRLTRATLSGSVTNIGKSAFSGCASLAELTIPDSVETIGTNALAGCSGLVRLEVPGSWWGTDKVATAGVPAGCEVAYRGVEPLAVATAALPGGKAGRSYQAVLEATGGTRPYEWAWMSGEYAETEAASTFAETGTASGSGTQTLELPFAFPFFESAYTQATIDNNGNIRFNNFQSGSPTIEVLRLEYRGGDDWLEGPWMQTDAISVEKAEDAVTVRWAGCYMWYDGLYMENRRGTPVNFSATLCADGTIVLSYGEGNYYGGEIGLFAGDGRSVLSAKSGSGSMAQAADVVFLPPKGVPRLALAEGGVLQGTPEEAGEYPVKVWVADASGAVASRELTLTIVEGGGGDATETTPVAVPHSWLESEAAAILTENGGDYEAAANALAANGRPVWQCYVAGLGVTDAGAEFKVKSIRVEDGVAHVEWYPDLREDEVPRTYTVWGTSELGAEVRSWTPVTADNIREMRYFAVEVGMGK